MKTILNLSIIALAIFIFSSVILNKQDSKEKDIETVVSNEQAENNIETDKDEENDDNSDYIGSNVKLENITDFSEGRAWIQFYETHRIKGSKKALEDAIDEASDLNDMNDLEKGLYLKKQFDSPGNNRAALIDTQGKILWKSDLTSEDTVLLETSEFKDGLAYCVFNGNDDKKSYNIIDSDGNVTFTRDYDENYKILNHGGGKFLVLEHTVNFNTNEWKIGAIDKNGNVVSPFKVYAPDKLIFEANGIQDSTYLSCEYHGENIYEFNLYGVGFDALFLNIETQNIIYPVELNDTENIGGIEFISDFENGTAIVKTIDGNGKDEICTLKPDGTLTHIADGSWISKISTGEYPDKIPYKKAFSEGLVFADYDPLSSENDLAGVFFDINGNIAVDFPEYRNKQKYHCDPFYNGYSAMLIEGKDELNYVTVVNKEGKLMFEPKSGFDVIYTSKDGKYAIAAKEGSVSVFDITGNSLLNIDCTDISGKKYDINNGVIKFDDFYVNVGNGSIIGLHRYKKVSITSYKD